MWNLPLCSVSCSIFVVSPKRYISTKGSYWLRLFTIKNLGEASQNKLSVWVHLPAQPNEVHHKLFFFFFCFSQSEFSAWITKASDNSYGDLRCSVDSTEEIDIAFQWEMDLWLTGRYLTETENSGKAPAKGREGETTAERKRVFPSLSRSLRKRRCLGESSTGEDELPFPCAVKDGRHTGGERHRKWEKQCGRGKGERGGNFSVCVFPSKTSWQGRAHSVAGRGGAILKSPTGSLRDAGESE